jgi:hypothetical protein
MEEKIYILMTSSGSYDDYRTHVIGIYTSMERAENGKNEYAEAIVKFFDENPCPVDSETAEKIDNYDITIDDENKPEFELYQDWVFKTDGVSDMCRDAWIVEKVLNKTDLEIIDDRSNYL